MIDGVVMSCGAAWVRPDFRGRILSQLFARLAKAYGLSRWPIDWIIGYVTPSGFKKGLHVGYGAKHTSPGMGYPGTSFGELYLLYTSASEANDDLADFLDTELSSGPGIVSHSWETILAQEVTRTSPEVVFQGPGIFEPPGRHGFVAGISDQLLGHLAGLVLGGVQVARPHPLVVDSVVLIGEVRVERFRDRATDDRLDLVGERLELLISVAEGVGRIDHDLAIQPADLSERVRI